MTRTITGMDAKSARTENMRRLVDLAGGATEWSERYSPLKSDGTPRWPQPQVSQWISPTAPKSIGHKLGRDLEQAMGLENGGLDREPPQSQSVRFDVDTMAMALEMVATQRQLSGPEHDSRAVASSLISVYTALWESRHLGGVTALLSQLGDSAEGG